MIYDTVLRFVFNQKWSDVVVHWEMSNRFNWKEGAKCFTFSSIVMLISIQFEFKMDVQKIAPSNSTPTTWGLNSSATAINHLVLAPQPWWPCSTKAGPTAGRQVTLVWHSDLGSKALGKDFQQRRQQWLVPSWAFPRPWPAALASARALLHRVSPLANCKVRPRAKLWPKVLLRLQLNLCIAMTFQALQAQENLIESRLTWPQWNRKCTETTQPVFY